jgi:hypothetical protein
MTKQITRTELKQILQKEDGDTIIGIFNQYPFSSLKNSIRYNLSILFLSTTSFYLLPLLLSPLKTVHAYDKSGSYTLSLIVDDNLGKWSEPATLTIAVNTPPTEPVNFSVLGDGTTNSVHIGEPVTIWINTTGNSSVTYHVLAGDYEIGTGKAPGEGIFKAESFTGIPMSCGEPKIKVGAVVKDKSLEWTIDVVNVWIEEVN